MARRGFGGTALRAALGAVTGVAEGMRVREEREFERQKAEEALNYQRQRDLLSDARQREQAAAQLRSEERQAAAAGMIGASQYTGLSPFDMPGATPRTPVLRQMIGGREMVLPEAKPVVEHRAEVAKALAERQKKQAEGAALRAALANVEIGGKKLGEEQAAALEKLDPNSRSIVLGARRDAARPQRAAGGGGGSRGLTATALEKIAQEERRAEAIFNKTMERNSPMRQALVETFNALRANNPEATPQELMRSAVAATNALKLPMETPKPSARGGRAGGGRAPTAPPPSMGGAPALAPAAPVKDELDTAYDRYTKPRG